MVEQLSPNSMQNQQPRPPRRGIPAVGWIAAIMSALFLVCGGLCFFLLLAGGTDATNSGQAGFGPAVGVIRVDGVISSGESQGGLNGGVVGADTLVRLIQQASANSDVKAIVLRVNSPGGGVVASDEIYHALKQAGKPIVVSMGDMAASGGYYISAPANYIYATPHTLTGSIGVISEFFVAKDMMDNVGIKVEVIKSGKVKDFGNSFRDMTDEEREYWQSVIDETYAGFVKVVADGRHMDEQRVRNLADGRVYSGQQALTLGLVDAIGYFDDAVHKAAELGGINGTPRIIEFQQRRSVLDSLNGMQSQTPLTLDMLRHLATPALQFRFSGP